MSAVRLDGPYYRANNTSRALNEARYWFKMGVVVAAIFVVWFVL